MRLGIFLPSGGAEPGKLAALAREAERLGFDSLWAPDHVFKVFGPILDPLTLLGYLAGVTERITLGTSVLVLPYRHPVAVANAVSSLDVLSGGRFVFGVGAGWTREEFAALGVPRRERGARTDEYLEVMKALWSGRPAGYSGRFVSFEESELGTDPLTPGGPPVLVGGASDAALKRALRFGYGWTGVGLDPDGISEVRRRLERFGRELGRDAGDLEVSTVHRIRPGDSPETVAGTARRFAAAGVELLILSATPMNREVLACISSEVAPAIGGGS
jgi:probable F420-dependent oxidoreductase